MVNIKKQVAVNEVLEVLYGCFGEDIKKLEEVKGGNLKAVYFFNYDHKDYVIKFSIEDTEFKKESYLYKILNDKDVPMARIVKVGQYKNYFYSISTKITGEALISLNEKQAYEALPSLISNISKVHFADVSRTKGYGWLNEKGNGIYNSWSEYLHGFFQKEQIGFWKDWYELFETSFLDNKIFNELYNEMLRLSNYCEGRRHIVHGDFHFGNVISNENIITGIIDWGNVMYGDFIFDVATMHMQFPKYNIVEVFKEHYKDNNILIPSFRERFLCCSLCKGLDALRFFAKLGDRGSCDSIVKYLYNLNF